MSRYISVFILLLIVGPAAHAVDQDPSAPLNDLIPRAAFLGCSLASVPCAKPTLEAMGDITVISEINCSSTGNPGIRFSYSCKTVAGSEAYPSTLTCPAGSSQTNFSACPYAVGTVSTWTTDYCPGSINGEVKNGDKLIEAAKDYFKTFNPCKNWINPPPGNAYALCCAKRIGRTPGE